MLQVVARKGLLHLELPYEHDVERDSALAHNVLARRRGAIPGRTVVIGAHFDHLGHGGEGSLAPDQLGSVPRRS